MRSVGLEKELDLGHGSVGPQRDDLRAELGGRDVATHASRGQQRTIILAMKLAETDLLGSDGGGSDPEVFQLAQHVDSDQRIEIDRMQQLLAESG